MAAHPHALEGALRALEPVDALTRGALAHQLNVTELDVQVLMLTAETSRLVYRVAEGEWAITEHGRRTLHQRHRAAPNRPPFE